MAERSFLSSTFAGFTGFAGAAFLTGNAFFAGAFLAATFFTGLAFLAVAFFAGAAFFAADFLATTFFATAFFAGLFLSALDTATIVLWFFRTTFETFYLEPFDAIPILYPDKPRVSA
ncbi:unannotated protein [freshwater metagenome]|uniref:Unannotated protein n=1 Tax=freshwater metagenome TaxID=449393 RepID=A0A6J6CID1_9ZZZZ